ncbi:glycine zipper domain-containing protein [Pontibacter sp. CAU 1760]
MNKLHYILSLLLLVAVAFGGSAEAQKKKWSPQAKGAIIGTATGATAGAVIHKRNRVVGGVIGGAVGGGAGYVIGKRIDNKNKEREAARIAEANRIAAANRAATARRAESNTVAATNRAATPASIPPAVAALNSYQTAQDPVIYNMALLPNDSYGDPTKPYYTSEYRRKSW